MHGFHPGYGHPEFSETKGESEEKRKSERASRSPDLDALLDDSCFETCCHFSIVSAGPFLTQIQYCRPIVVETNATEWLKFGPALYQRTGTDRTEIYHQ